MATNPYFNNYSMKPEQGVFESSVIELIQIAGTDVVFIPREIFELDPILKEPKKTVFRRNFTIEAMQMDGGNFDGEQAIMSQFNFRIDQQAEFIISKKRFSELGTGLLRPREGDLIYLGDPDNPHGSFTNTMWLINQCWYNNPEWQFGKQFVYRLVCTTFKSSYERFETGKVGPDQLNMDNAAQVEAGINHEVDDASQPLINWDVTNPLSGF